MAWRDQISKTQASFRGVPFKTVEADLKVGRRVALHEYPGRDDPYAEDMGRRARLITVEAYVVGDTYLAQRDALIKALEQAGPGDLVHPRYGQVRVQVQDYATVKESPREGGLARFSITFVQAGRNELPNRRVDTAAAVAQRAQAVDQRSAESFGRRYRATGGRVEQDALKALSNDLARIRGMATRVMNVASVAALVASVSSVASNLAGLIRLPVNLAQGIQSLFIQTVTGLLRPLAALAELRSVFGANPRPAANLVAAAIPGSTRARTLAADQARSDLQRQAAISSAARVLLVAGNEQIDNASQAREARDLVLAMIDEELDRNDPEPDVASALVDLRAAVVRDVAERMERLPELGQFEPLQVGPALLLAQRIYSDAGRADELVARNRVRHPLFVPAQPLEVLL